jgi:hypothetical protein
MSCHLGHTILVASYRKPKKERISTQSFQPRVKLFAPELERYFLGHGATVRPCLQVQTTR